MKPIEQFTDQLVAKGIDYIEFCMHELFSSDMGQTILNHYIEEDYGRGSVNPFELTAEALAYEEGRRSVIRDFIQNIENFKQKSSPNGGHHV